MYLYVIFSFKSEIVIKTGINFVTHFYSIVNYEIVELEEFSGNKATIYSIVLEGDDVTLFDHFVEENIADFRNELINNDSRTFAGDWSNNRSKR